MENDLARLQRSPRDIARWRKAQEHLLCGRHAPALKLYRELAPRYSKVAELWFELGNAAAGELDFALANEAYDRVMQLSPGNASLLVMVGQQYQGLRQLDDARACFERAVAVDPASVDARISLAVWFEKERRLDDAWEAVTACLARHPGDDQARYFQAFLLHRKGRNGEAETALRDLIKDGPQYPYVKYAGRHLLGVVLDQMGRPAEAMRWLLEAKAQVRTLTDIGILEREYDKADAKRRELLAALTPEMIRRWRSEGPASELGRPLAFLGGHPRSGTTLLEQVLDAHPEILAFDEPVAFNQEVAPNAALPAAAGEIQARTLDGLPAALRGQWRQRYLKSLLREVTEEPGARLFLDKNPSPTMSLPIWLRVFPEIKVIIALRDPRDVLISCFFLNLMLNSSNANFLSLERTAKHYQDLMDVWLRMRDLGGFDWLETRYEDMVNSVETEGARVTAFLGLTWHPDQARYHETARRKFLFAPTYHDVTQPVYRRAMGRWEQYAEALEPLQARLAPYCRAFGYAT
jgi:tetratricopeptide (TPR) repeat protein